MNQIYWSAEAKDTYAAILNYVMDNFPIDVAIKMDDKVERLIKSLSSNSYLCPPSFQFQGIRRCVITKHLSVAYRTDGNEIELIAFFDNRMKHPF